MKGGYDRVLSHDMMSACSWAHPPHVFMPIICFIGRFGFVLKMGWKSALQTCFIFRLWIAVNCSYGEASPTQWKHWRKGCPLSLPAHVSCLRWDHMYVKFHTLFPCFGLHFIVCSLLLRIHSMKLWLPWFYCAYFLLKPWQSVLFLFRMGRVERFSLCLSHISWKTLFLLRIMDLEHIFNKLFLAPGFGMNSFNIKCWLQFPLVNSLR